MTCGHKPCVEVTWGVKTPHVKQLCTLCLQELQEKLDGLLKAGLAFLILQDLK